MKYLRGGLQVFNYHCKTCKKDIQRKESIDFDWIRNKEGKEIYTLLEKCECGGELDSGIYRPPYCGQKAGMITIENVTMGISLEQVPEAMKMYPGSEYNERGNLVTKGVRQQEKEALRRGLIVK